MSASQSPKSRASAAGNKVRTSRRGRPPHSADRQLSDQLLRAAEVGLSSKSHLDLTTREIATIAGTHPHMIHYYFNSKDGLLSALTDLIVDDVNKRLSRVERELDREPAPVQRIVRELVEAFYPHAAAASVMLIEAQRSDSAIRHAYATRNSSRIFLRINRLFLALMDGGYFRKDLDSGQATWSLLSLIAGPMILRPFWMAEGKTVDELDSARWIDNITRMLEGVCLARPQSH